MTTPEGIAFFHILFSRELGGGVFGVTNLELGISGEGTSDSASFIVFKTEDNVNEQGEAE